MKLTISIPKPCHEDWSAMHERKAGRFCDSCQHTVADLTRATDAELVALFSSDAKPKCARFDPAQLDRVLATPPERNPVHALQATVLSGALALGASPAVAQMGIVAPPPMGKPEPRVEIKVGEMRCTPVFEQDSTRSPITGDTIAIALPEDAVTPIIMDGLFVAPEEGATGQATVETGTLVSGMVVEQETNEPIPFATVMVDGDKIVASTDFDGRFKIRIPEDASPDEMTLRVRIAGFHDRVVPLRSPQVAVPTTEPPKGAPAARGKGTVSGLLRTPEGKPARNALVVLLNTDVFQYTDEHGLFSFDPPDGYAEKMVRLKITVDGMSKGVEVPADRLPFCVPVDVEEVATNSPEVGKRDGSIDAGVIRMDSGAWLGGVVLSTWEPDPPSVGQRIVAPFRGATRWIGGLFE